MRWFIAHSAEGTTWEKKDHKYVKKVFEDGKWHYYYKDDEETIAKNVKDKQEYEAATGAKKVMLGMQLSESVKNMSLEELAEGRMYVYGDGTHESKVRQGKKNNLKTHYIQDPEERRRINER